MLTEAIENLFNRNLGQSPRARELCRELQGKPLRVEISSTPWVISVESLGHSLRMSSRADEQLPVATVRGSPVNLLALAGSDPQAVIRRGDVRIEGDAEVAESYQQLLHCLRPDVEEELSRLVGDSTAHEVVRIARLAFGFGKRALDTGVRNTAEYFAHESGDLVPRAEAEHFLDQVGRLREDADRLEARIALLEARRESSAR
jgi:ubiquinone biosynthesis protein UbiJ